MPQSFGTQTFTVIQGELSMYVQPQHGRASSGSLSTDMQIPVQPPKVYMIDQARGSVFHQTFHNTLIPPMEEKHDSPTEMENLPGSDRGQS